MARFAPYAIGDRITVGEGVAHIGTVALTAPLAGVLRGLTHDGVPAAVGTKVMRSIHAATQRACGALRSALAALPMVCWSRCGNGSTARPER